MESESEPPLKKEVYKLIFVFIMIAFSFSLAFFLGREITLSNKNNKNSSLTDQKTEQTDKPSIDSSMETLIPKEKTQREKVEQYKEKLSLKKEGSTTTTKQKPQAATQKTDTMYGVLIGNYDDKTSAIKQSTQMKIRFPQWKVFFRESEDSYKVYIGPFKKKEDADFFLKELKQKSEFSYVKLEKI